MSMVTRDMGLNILKAEMDLNLASNLRYLFSLMKTLLSLSTEWRSAMLFVRVGSIDLRPRLRRPEPLRGDLLSLLVSLSIADLEKLWRAGLGQPPGSPQSQKQNKTESHLTGVLGATSAVAPGFNGGAAYKEQTMTFYRIDVFVIQQMLLLFVCYMSWLGCHWVWLIKTSD